MLQNGRYIKVSCLACVVYTTGVHHTHPPNQEKIQLLIENAFCFMLQTTAVIGSWKCNFPHCQECISDPPMTDRGGGQGFHKNTHFQIMMCAHFQSVNQTLLSNFYFYHFYFFLLHKNIIELKILTLPLQRRKKKLHLRSK